ncbi:haloacid dehalogenase [Sulfolobus acidocaldarius SUSAZ]|nr:haloacid dehalogenase [Sulfolobus acidocaldarius SUSAZ]
MVTETLKTYISTVVPKLQDRFDAREKAFSISREIIRYAGEAISLSHRFRKDEALNKYKLALEKLDNLKKLIEKYPELLYGEIATAFQEVAEATIVISIYFNQNLLIATDLGIPDAFYILGIADAIGELRRKTLEHLRKKELEEAEKTYQMMEELYELLWELEYPKALVPNLRQKIDAMRRVLEETHHDIFLAYLR